MTRSDPGDGEHLDAQQEFISRLTLSSRHSQCLGIVVTDREQQIQFLNETFMRETGYTLAEIMGKNTRILQGSQTSKNTTTNIRKALCQTHPQPIQTTLLNYRKDGSPFLNQMYISPLFDSSGAVSHFIGVHIYTNPYPEKPLKLFPWLSSSEHDSQQRLGLITNPKGPKPALSFVSETLLPTKHGSFRVRAYRDLNSKAEPLVMLHGEWNGSEAVPVRVHDQCFTSEVLGSLKCDCREQLEYSLRYVQQQKGVVIYLQQEGRGMGLANKLKAYQLQQEHGYDTVDANRVLGFEQDTRDYSVVPEILTELRVGSVKLMTNNPRKIERLRELGVCVKSRIPIHVDSDEEHSQGYMKTKLSRMGHFLSFDG